MKYMKRFSLYLLFVVSFFFFTCSHSQKKQIDSSKEKQAQLSYAHGFKILYHPSYKEVFVKNPWMENSTLGHYYLVENPNIKTPSDGVKIKIPLQSLAATSCTHFEFIYMLSEASSISGICSPELVYNEDIRKRYQHSEIENLGDAFNLNFEKTLLLHPDAIMMSGYNQQDENAKRIMQAGIPVIYNNEWTESSLLGRSEWIKFVAAFYNKEKLADSLFSIIEKKYIEISHIARKVNEKPTILSGANFKGTWYMPGGESYIGQLLTDAGSNYFYQSDSSKNSLPLNFETVVKNFQHADYWIGCNAESINELTKSDERYALFDATQTGQIYNFNKKTTTAGGNDFWESAIAHPDLLLSDMIKILHPNLLPDHQLIYMKKLE